MRATDVFTPNDFPEHTYVPRDEVGIEQRLRDALDTPNEVISVSGPSKSGKTVLVERLVGVDKVIHINGSTLHADDSLWDRLLDQLDAPLNVNSGSGLTLTGGVEASAEGGAGIPFVASGKAGAKLSASGAHQTTTAEQRGRSGMEQAVQILAGSGIVVFIDDFHYIVGAEVQTQVARQIRAGAGRGIRFVTASVPHRSDDVVRANPELRGRIQAIDTTDWVADDLIKIGEIGFPLLNLRVSRSDLASLAKEASGSPQLMQAMCLQACFSAGYRDGADSLTDLRIDSEFKKFVLEETSRRADFSSLVREMHAGPRTRGVERKVHRLADGTDGDVYRSVLLALAADPPTLVFTSRDLVNRVGRVCIGEQPQNASINRACQKMAAMALNQGGDARVLDWSDDDEVLEITDPYFLFYLRWSSKLAELGR